MNELADLLRAEPDRVALLAGSGMSRSASILTGEELIGLLAARHGAQAVPSPLDWYLSAFGRWPSYEAILYEAYAVDRRAGPETFFAPGASDAGAGLRVPQRAHRALADLVKAGYFRLILTTNFDRLIETALRDAGLTPRVASLPADMARPPGCEPCLLKLHGDYADLMPKVLERRQDEYADAEIRMVLDRIFAAYHVVVCGWSASWDTALAEALALAGAGKSVYWLTVGELTEPAALIVKLRNATVVTIDSADACFGELAALLSE